jgi:hypothetical protein
MRRPLVTSDLSLFNTGGVAQAGESKHDQATYADFALLSLTGLDVSSTLAIEVEKEVYG